MRTTFLRAVGVCVPLLSLSAGASAQFVEPDAEALCSFTGTGNHGWAVSELRDINGDGVTDGIISANQAARVVVVSGADCAILHDISGAPGSSFGYAIADAGFVDADNVPDFVVGAVNANASAGAAFIYSGADGSVIHTLSPSGAGEFLGAACAGLGDVNGDGRDDVAVGAPRFAGSTGRVYVFSGMDGSVIRTIDGEDGLDQFGVGTAGLGDIDGDGISELGVGAMRAGPTSRGRSYIYSGATGALVRGPFDALNTAQSYGQFFVGTLGDVDNDGVPDMYVGDFSDTVLGQGTGRAYLYSGATGSTIFIFRGASAGAGMGPGRGAGDLDGDGHADIIVGSYTSSEGAPTAGKVEVRSGASGLRLQQITSTLNGINLGFDAVGIGDVDGDGTVDYLASGATGNRVYILKGVAPLPECRADCTQDQEIDFDDLVCVLFMFGNPSDRSDCNGDGLADFSDLICLLFSFGPCE